MEAPPLANCGARSAPGSNLKPKRKRLSIVFATVYAAKQGAEGAIYNREARRPCDRCGVADGEKITYVVEEFEYSRCIFEEFGS